MRHTQVTVIAIMAAAETGLAQPAIVRIPLPSDPLYSRVIVTGVAADGSAVVGNCDARSSAVRFVAMRWTPSGGTQLLNDGSTPWSAEHAFAVSSNGNVITGRGWNSATNTEVGFRWTPQGFIALPSPAGGTGWNDPYDVSPDGAASVGSASPQIAALWTAQGASALPLPSGMTGATAWCFTRDGSAILGTASSAASGGVYVWRNGQPHLLTSTLLPGRRIVDAASDATASAIVGQAVDSSGWTEAVRWTASTGMVEVGFVMPTDVDAALVSTTSDGRTAVGYSASAHDLFAYRAAIWREGRGFEYLDDVLVSEFGVNLDGWSLHKAAAITADGSIIIGNGTRDGYLIEGWMIRLSAPCYPNCDGSTAAPALNVADFTCFLQRFATGDPHANCDASTASPTLNVLDFTCFLQKFAAGCP